MIKNNLIDDNIINNSVLGGEHNKNEKHPSYKNGKDVLAEVEIMEFSSNNQKISFNVPECCWLNFINDEKFLFLPGIIFIIVQIAHT